MNPSTNLYWDLGVSREMHAKQAGNDGLRVKGPQPVFLSTVVAFKAYGLGFKV